MMLLYSDTLILLCLDVANVSVEIYMYIYKKYIYVFTL